MISLNLLMIYQWTTYWKITFANDSTPSYEVINSLPLINMELLLKDKLTAMNSFL